MKCEDNTETSGRTQKLNSLALYVMLTTFINCIIDIDSVKEYGRTIARRM